MEFDFLGENRHHYDLSPELKELLAMALANVSALTAAVADLATVAQQAVTALGAEPTSDTAATIAAVSAATTSITGSTTALTDALTPPVTELTILPMTLPSPVLNTAYSVQLTVTGGDGADTYSLESGSLPDGLTLSPAGEISGTPTTSGSYVFEISVTDTSLPPLTGSASYAVTVATSGS